MGAASMRSPRDERRHVLEVNAIVTGGQLQAVWSYSSGSPQNAIEGVAQDFLSSLRSLIEHQIVRRARLHAFRFSACESQSRAARKNIRQGQQARQVINKDELQNRLKIFTVIAHAARMLFSSLLAPQSGCLRRAASL